MEIMKNSHLLLLACLVIPLAATAGDPPKPAVKPATKAASAPAHANVPAMSASNLKAEVQASKNRGQLMGACHKKATDQQLQEPERKTFLTACMAGK